MATLEQTNSIPEQDTLPERNQLIERDVANIRAQYMGVIDQNPQILLEIINNLDTEYKNSGKFLTLLKAVLSADETIQEEDLEYIYKKSRVLGDLMMETKDYKRAKIYLFIALKAKELYTRPLTDQPLLIDLAESIFLDKETVAHQDDNIQALVKTQLNQEKRLDTAKSLLLTALANNPNDIDALRLLSEISAEYASAHIDLVTSPDNQISDVNLRYIIYNFKEARTYALKSAILEQETDTDELDLSLYVSISIEFATFLAEIGENKRAMAIFQELIDKGANQAIVKTSIASTIMPNLLVWKNIRNENMENHRNYMGLRNTILKYLNEVINLIDPETEQSSENLLIYISANYNIALILLWEGAIESAENKARTISKINHPQSQEWADDLRQHISDEIKKRLKTPKKS